MAYGQNNIIVATDFNSRATAVNNIWGTGSGTNGYGQSTTVSSVSASGIVTASDWATLVARISSIQQHQSNNTTGIPAQPASGGIVTYLSGIDTAINNFVTNKNTVYTTTQISATANTNSTAFTQWKYSQFTYVWANANAIRYFFNSGGAISLTANACTLSPTVWNTFVNTGYNYTQLTQNTFTHSGTVGTYTRNVYTTTAGFTFLGSSPTTVLTMVDTGEANTNYTANVLRLTLAYDGTATITANLAVIDNDTNTFGRTVTGGLVTQPKVNYPETTYLTTNSWGVVNFTSTTGQT